MENGQAHLPPAFAVALPDRLAVALAASQPAVAKASGILDELRQIILPRAQKRVPKMALRSARSRDSRPIDALQKNKARPVALARGRKPNSDAGTDSQGVTKNIAADKSGVALEARKTIKQAADAARDAADAERAGNAHTQSLSDGPNARRVGRDGRLRSGRGAFRAEFQGSDTTDFDSATKPRIDTKGGKIDTKPKGSDPGLSKAADDQKEAAEGGQKANSELSGASARTCVSALIGHR